MINPETGSRIQTGLPQLRTRLSCGGQFPSETSPPASSVVAGSRQRDKLLPATAPLIARLESKRAKARRLFKRIITRILLIADPTVSAAPNRALPSLRVYYVLAKRCRFETVGLRRAGSIRRIARVQRRGAPATTFRFVFKAPPFARAAFRF